jgi:enamine deaminase RidA (YjgF/YER057c/UK114 family)
MNIRRSPESVAAPFGPYSQSIEVPGGSRLLYIAGQVGAHKDGSIPEGIEAQAEGCWHAIAAILADAGMGIKDLVKITTFLTRAQDTAVAGAARARHLGDNRPASTTVIVGGLVAANMLIEIEAVAAKA